MLVSNRKNLMMLENTESGNRNKVFRDRSRHDLMVLEYSLKRLSFVSTFRVWKI